MFIKVFGGEVKGEEPSTGKRRENIDK